MLKYDRLAYIQSILLRGFYSDSCGIWTFSSTLFKYFFYVIKPSSVSNTYISTKRGSLHVHLTLIILSVAVFIDVFFLKKHVQLWFQSVLFVTFQKNRKAGRIIGERIIRFLYKFFMICSACAIKKSCQRTFVESRLI